MKKFCWLFIFLAICGTAQAEFYPDRVFENPDSALEISGFFGLYQKIYDHTHEENEEILLERVCQSSEILCSDESQLVTISDLEKIGDGGVPGFRPQGTSGKSGYSSFRNFVSDRFDLERSLLRQENFLALTGSLALIFSDGDAGDQTANSPFDVITDLNKIDSILFGEKAEQPDPEFSKKPKTDIISNPENYDTDFETWLDQRESQQPSKTEFSSTDQSVAASLQEITKIFQNLNSHSLVAGMATKEMWELPFAGGIFGGSGQSFQASESPYAPVVPIGMETSKLAQFGHELEGILSAAMVDQQTEDWRIRLESIFSQSKTEAHESLENIRKNRENIFKKTIQNFKTVLRKNSVEKNAVQIDNSLDNLNTVFSVMLENTKLWNQWFTTFLQKPQE
ncbi:hypothetical protein HN954_02750 [bacterium]|nr:hypothetical protein [bacterium]MBT6831677.1 hypothetical protein [bacterium]MBT6996323.1 hypothetical protein [bacterium]MBT7773001.1 hypothetical protein [bacterium]